MITVAQRQDPRFWFLGGGQEIAGTDISPCSEDVAEFSAFECVDGWVGSPDRRRNHPSPSV